MLIDGCVHLGLDGDVELIEEFEQPPDADAIAVVAPGEDAMGVGLFWRGDPCSLALAIAELLDVDRYIYREPPAPGPTIVRPLGDVGICGSAMRAQHAIPPSDAVRGVFQNRSEDRHFAHTLQVC